MVNYLYVFFFHFQILGWNEIVRLPAMIYTRHINTDTLFVFPEYFCFLLQIKLAAEWKVQDANKKNIFCFVIPIEIVD